MRSLAANSAEAIADSSYFNKNFAYYGAVSTLTLDAHASLVVHAFYNEPCFSSLTRLKCLP